MMKSWLAGAILGLAAGAVGGFLAGLCELMLRRAENRARRGLGGPVARNEVLPPIWLLGTVAGAVAGAVTIGLGGWTRAVLAGFGVPIAAWLTVRLVSLGFDRIRG